MSHKYIAFAKSLIDLDLRTGIGGPTKSTCDAKYMAVSEAARWLKAPINPDLKFYPETKEEERSLERAKA